MTELATPIKKAEIRGSKFGVDITGSYFSDTTGGIRSQIPRLFALSTEQQIINNGKVTKLVQSTFDRKGTGINDLEYSRSPHSPNVFALSDYKFLTAGRDGDYLNIDGVPGTYGTETGIPLLVNSAYRLKGNVVSLKSSPDTKKILVCHHAENSNKYSVLLVNRSDNASKVSNLNIGDDMTSVDYAINTTKEFETVKQEAIYAVATTPRYGENTGKIIIFNQDGVQKEIINQPAMRIISGPPGIFYFVTEDQKIGMIDTSKFGDTKIGGDPDKSLMKIVYENPHKRDMSSIISGPNETIIFSENYQADNKPWSVISVIDGQTGDKLGEKHMKLKADQSIDEMAIEPKGKEVFYVLKTKNSTPSSGPSYQLKSLHLSVTQK